METHYRILSEDIFSSLLRSLILLPCQVQLPPEQAKDCVVCFFNIVSLLYPKTLASDALRSSVNGRTECVSRASRETLSYTTFQRRGRLPMDSEAVGKPSSFHISHQFTAEHPMGRHWETSFSSADLVENGGKPWATVIVLAECVRITEIFWITIFLDLPPQ